MPEFSGSVHAAAQDEHQIAYLKGGELLEVTPVSLRIRKRVLESQVRGCEDKRAKEAVGA